MSSTAITFLCSVSVRGVEKPDHLLALEFAGLSFNLSFLAFLSDFLFAACHLFTISDPCHFGKTKTIEVAVIWPKELKPVEYSLVIEPVAEVVVEPGPVGMVLVVVIMFEPVVIARPSVIALVILEPRSWRSLR